MNIRYLRESCVVLSLPLVLVAARAEDVTEELVVTATPRRNSADEISQSVTVVNGADLDRLRSANLGETLESQLGMSASFFGAGASRPTIRGLAGPRVRTMEDGIDSLDVATVSVDHAVSISPAASHQIEIFRGPTTLLYGSGAVGGVVNTVTNRIPAVAPRDGLDGVIELQANTVADDRALSLVVDGGGNVLAWHFDAMSQDSGDYRIPGYAGIVRDELEPLETGHDAAFGYVENSDVEVDSAAAGMGWLRDSGFFGISLSSYASNYGLPGHGHHEDEGGVEAEPAVRIDLAQTRFDLGGAWLGMSGPVESINLRLGVNDYAHVELEGAAAGTRFSNDAWEGRIELLHSPWGAWQGAFGLQVAQREFSAIGDEAFVPPTDTSTYGIFMIEQRAMEHWDLSMGGRLDRQRHRPGDGLVEVEEAATSFSFATMRELGERHALGFNFASAERLPGSDELFSNGPHLATGTVEVGDRTLGAERSKHLDISVRRTMGALRWSLTAFMTDYDDYIYLRDTGVVDVDHELPVFAFTQAGAEFTGLEAEFIAPLAELGSGVIDIRIFADSVEGTLKAGGYLPQMPPRRAGARLQYHNARIAAGIEASRYDDQRKIAGHETPTAAYTMLNADFLWTIGTGTATSYEIFLRGSNLLDEDARRHTSFLKDEVPLPGRNYAAGFRARF